MASTLALNLPTTTVAPVRPAGPVALATAPVGPAGAWSLDLFRPTTPVAPAAPVAATVALRPGATIDELEGNDPTAGGWMPVHLNEPIGSGGAIVLRGGSRGAYVTRLQEKLQAAGFNPGAIDGAFGARTEQAVKNFQRANGLRVDGIVGANTWNALGQGSVIEEPAAPSPATPAAPSGNGSGDEARLRGTLRNRYWQRKRQCFRYAWTAAVAAGGKPYGRATEFRTGRGQSTAHLGTLAANGTLKPGDVIYVNRSPGADPSSTNMRYGPHWMVYLGRGQFADQYGVRDARAMDAFVPGRKIDLLFRTM